MGWVQQRKDLYKQLRSQVVTLLGEEPASLKDYRSQYENEFAKSWKPASRDELIISLINAKILFFADFHALQQSQKAHLRLLRSLNLKRKKIIFLECIEARYQNELDAYCAGKISEQDFLKSVAWQKSWGFPWEHYRPIFMWAKKHKVKLVGVNHLAKHRTTKSLRKRDRFAAQVITRVIREFPGHQLIVIFGDLHLAERHLPTELLRKNHGLRKNDMVTVFQNSEKIYFDLLNTHQELQVDIVKLRSQSYCLLSVPPWVKWQSYLMFLESHFDAALDEEETDYSDHVDKYYKLLCKDFSVEYESGHYSVYSANDDIVFEKLEQVLSGYDLKWYQYLIQYSKSFYCPEIRAIYLGKPSVNAAASLAMAILHARLAKMNTGFTKMPGDFEALIFVEAIQYFGSKMINPRRKTDTELDLRNLFASRQEIREGREAISLALAQKMKERVALAGAGKRKIELPMVRRKTSYYEASRMLGGIIGEKLYSGFRSKMISKAMLIKLLSTPIRSSHFQNFYYEFLELVETFPEPFQSKVEKV